MAEALGLLPRAARQADIVELRLDAFDEAFALEQLVEAAGACPLIVTLRPVGQGGRSTLPAEARLAHLVRAVELGAAFVDLESDAAPPAAIEALHRAGGEVLVSYHDFEAMPADLIEHLAPRLDALGADIAKMAGAARDVRDCLPILDLLHARTAPTVAMAMGVAGLPTRILALREPACFLTYAALDGAAPTAPGQPRISELRRVYHADRISGETAAYGLLGSAVDGVLTERYNRWFAEADVDAVAVPFVSSAETVDRVVNAYRRLPVAGWHIADEPAQRQVGAAVDVLSGAARAQGRVNAITLRDDLLVGDWVDAPEAPLELWTGRSARLASA
ncbi:MAG: type I 3-dehydroquinate dehydratase [Chloroflexi bacterium]|nr:type I 3-dehydroquinate dehydratase [Chloroflexota bacterium]